MCKSVKAAYDLSKLKSRKNLYASKLKKPVTIRLSEDVVAYFKGMADDAGVPYQSLINLYLGDCLATSRKVQIKWPQAA
jgi:predicted DNA binding CopG/RHH family protein